MNIAVFSALRSKETTMRLGLRVLSSLLFVVVTTGTTHSQERTWLSKGPNVATVHRNISRFEAIPPAAQTPISRTLGREQHSYHATAEAGGFRVENSTQGISAEFNSSGLALCTGSEKWAMRLSQYGYTGAMHDAETVVPHAEANRIEYPRGELSEWYLNGPFGLEQGFTFARPPGKRNGALTLAIVLSANLTPKVDPGAHGLTLERQGVLLARYEGLLARDASGKELKSWMEVTGTSLQLRIEDARARYPVTVDPLVQSATLTDPDPNEQNSSFGETTAISSDGGTIVIGNPFPVTGPGDAYVFLRPSTGWATTSTYAAKLLASNGQAGDEFGFGLSITGDGTTIAVGAPGSMNGGSAYVFVEPSGGWTSSSPLHETNSIGGPTGFGYPLQLSDDGTTLAVASPLATVNGIDQQGEVEVFVTSNGWTSFSSNQLFASDGAANDRLSFDGVGISGDGSAIVATGAISTGAFEPRSAYVFLRPSGGWVGGTESAKLTASSYFGLVFPSLTSDGSTIVVGSPSDDTNTGNSGTAYVFVKPAGGWSSTSNFDAQLSPSTLDYNFGDGVTIMRDGTNIVVRGDSDYVFAKPATGWSNSNETAKFGAVSPQNITSLSASDVTSATRPPFLTMVDGEPSVEVNGNSLVPFVRVFTGYVLSSLAVTSSNNLTYSSIAAGTSSTQDVTLTNSGTAPLTISSVAATGVFSSTENCVTDSPLGPGADCTETVTFPAGGVGPYNGTLTFTDDSGEVDNSTQQVSLSANVIQAGTSTTIALASPDPALVGQSVTFDFSVAPPINNTLAPSGTVTIMASTGEMCTGSVSSGSCSITFSTPVTRTVSASYGGDTNFTSSTSSNVSEQVTDFILSASPSSQTVSPGHLASYTLTAKSTNGFTGTLNLSCGSLPAHTNCAVSPASLNLTGSIGTAAVTINLENKGTYTFTFVGSDGALVHTATANLTVK